MLRRVMIVWLCGVAPLAYGLELQGALPRLASFGGPAASLAILRTIAVAAGVAAGLALVREAPHAWQLVRGWALISLLAAVITLTTPYFPSNRTPFHKRLALGGAAIVYSACAIYASRRARDENP